jgi:hypothetical protein
VRGCSFHAADTCCSGPLQADTLHTCTGATDENFSGSFGVLGVQIAFEVFVLVVFLWARSLAARAFPRDPSGEAKALIWIIFASDTFAELAFVNVEFGSGVFWVMVFMDFAMIVMRDAVRYADSLCPYL